MVRGWARARRYEPRPPFSLSAEHLLKQHLKMQPRETMQLHQQTEEVLTTYNMYVDSNFAYFLSLSLSISFSLYEPCTHSRSLASQIQPRQSMQLHQQTTATANTYTPSFPISYHFFKHRWKLLQSETTLTSPPQVLTRLRLLCGPDFLISSPIADNEFSCIYLAKLQHMQCSRRVYRHTVSRPPACNTPTSIFRVSIPSHISVESTYVYDFNCVQLVLLTALQFNSNHEVLSRAVFCTLQGTLTSWWISVTIIFCTLIYGGSGPA